MVLKKIVFELWRHTIIDDDGLIPLDDGGGEVNTRPRITWNLTGKGCGLPNCRTCPKVKWICVNFGTWGDKVRGFTVSF